MQIRAQPDPDAPHPQERSVLAWMCLLIGVNQLGFGAVIPVLPLYAQSFGVSQAAIGATVAVTKMQRWPCSRCQARRSKASELSAGLLHHPQQRV